MDVRLSEATYPKQNELVGLEIHLETMENPRNLTKTNEKQRKANEIE